MDPRDNANDRNPDLTARARAAYERTVNPRSEGRALSPTEREAMAKALAALPRQLRDIFLAVRIDGLSFRQVSDRIGVSEDQVQRDVLTAFQALCRALEQPAQPSRWRRLLRIFVRNP